MPDPITRGTCANTEGTACSKPAPNTCSRCYLVQYCSKECQKSHWPLHKIDCNSPLLKATWKPSWDIEGRQPAFIENGSGMGISWGAFYGQRKYLWGNVPALDVVNVVQNEDNDLPSTLRLLFAASGDMRNVVKTLARLPQSYTGQCEIVTNDKDFDIVARNAILLLIAIFYPPELSADLMLHVWYSAFITEKMLRGLQEKILPHIKDVCEKIQDKPPTSLQSKSWSSQGRTLRLVLRKSVWDKLQTYFEIPVALSKSRAKEIMVAITIAPERKDYRERAWYAKPPGWRLCMMKFRTEGILLPFGASTASFNVPNPTIFRANDFWPMMDSADPLAGWPIKEVMRNASEVKNDLYGGLHRLVRNVLQKFCDSLTNRPTRFQLFHVDALQLPELLTQTGMGEHSFDRVEVSNIVDGGYLGTAATLSILAPLLKRKSQNPHATLVALYLNAVHEQSNKIFSRSNMEAELNQVMKYFPSFHPSMLRVANARYSCEIIKLTEARILLRDFDPPFNDYAREENFEVIGKELGLQVKVKNTIVEKWPMRLKEAASKEEFDICFGSGHVGCERYVEWERV